MLKRLAIEVGAILTFGRRRDSIAGPAKVIDGDTIVVAGRLVRLHGIDAPERDQTLAWRGERLPCGQMALAALEALIAGDSVRCAVVEQGRHGRAVAKVFTPDGTDVGHRLVTAGWALAYRRYSTDYVEAETEARKARRGLWRGTFEEPWAWRAASALRRPSAGPWRPG
jgi:endonuclease YncB( thermonuclease family)